jgi:hypothetical protein
MRRAVGVDTRTVTATATPPAAPAEQAIPRAGASPLRWIGGAAAAAMIAMALVFAVRAMLGPTFYERATAVCRTADREFRSLPPTTTPARAGGDLRRLAGIFAAQRAGLAAVPAGGQLAEARTGAVGVAGWLASTARHYARPVAPSVAATDYARAVHSMGIFRALVRQRLRELGLPGCATG